jgi:hypothetical protein
MQRPSRKTTLAGNLPARTLQKTQPSIPPLWHHGDTRRSQQGDYPMLNPDTLSVKPL